MTTSIVSNPRRMSLLATFAVGALVLMGARARAADPEQVDPITVSNATVKVVGRDSATGAPIEDVTRTVRIQYDPATLTLNSGVALLNYKVQEAAREACDSIAPLDTDMGTCLQNAIDSAKPQVDAAVAKARSTANS